MRPDFDGKRYGFPGAAPGNSGLDALRWAIKRRPAAWPRWIENPPSAPVIDRVHGETLRVTFINHATVLLQHAGLNVLTDPVWAQRVSPMSFAGPARRRAPGLDLEALPPIDAVLLSHGHYDHLCVRTLARLAEQHAPVVLAPLGHGTLLASRCGIDAIELDWWERAPLGDELDATLVPARHWTARGLLDRNRALWGGFVLHSATGSIYFAGDTGYGNGRHFTLARERFGPFRLALLPIGAYEPRWFMKPEHMNPAEAVQALQDLDAAQAMAIHYGTFQLTDEAHDAPVRALTDALREVPHLQFRALDNGACWNVAPL